MDKKTILETIECHKIFGEIKQAEDLKTKYKQRFNKMERDMKTKDQTFEGTLTAAGWDRYERVNQLSLFTQDDEDILLEHSSLIKKFAPYMNKKVKIIGDITSSNDDVRRVAVKKITRLIDGFSRTTSKRYDDLDQFFPHDAA